MTTHRYPRRMEIKRHRLLEAAQEIFLEKGFHAASMSDIAKKAEVSPPHIYNFYKNKADLAMAVQERMNQEIFDTLKNSMFEERSIDKDGVLGQSLKTGKSSSDADFNYGSYPRCQADGAFPEASEEVQRATL